MPGGGGDTVGDEATGSVGEESVDAAGMSAACGVLACGGTAVGAGHEHVGVSDSAAQGVVGHGTIGWADGHENIGAVAGAGASGVMPDVAAEIAVLPSAAPALVVVKFRDVNFGHEQSVRRAVGDLHDLGLIGDELIRAGVGNTATPEDALANATGRRSAERLVAIANEIIGACRRIARLVGPHGARAIGRAEEDCQKLLGHYEIWGILPVDIHDCSRPRDFLAPDTA